MTKVKNMSRAEAVALSHNLPNYFGVRPMAIPFAVPSMTQNPSRWIEIPIPENVCNGVTCGANIKFPIQGREYEIIHNGHGAEMLLLGKLISHLSKRASVRVFREESNRYFLCTNADATTIGSALNDAGQELFASYIPSCTAYITE